MSVNNLKCDICQTNIPYGAAYISICYNIEQMERDHINMRDSVTVISSEQMFTMCGRCGNRNQAGAVNRILKTTLSTKYHRAN